MRIITALAGLTLFATSAAAQTFGGYQVQLNGSGGNGTPLVTGGGVLQLMNDDYSSATSAFTTTTFDFLAASTWSTSFRLHYAFTSDENGFGAGGDGIAFVMQSGAATAGGIGGASMGYEGINSSVAVAFRSFWDDVLVGADGTLDGTTPFAANPAGIGIAPTGLASDFFVDALISYDGAGMLSLTYTPTNGAGTFTGTHAIDVSSLGSTVRLGFTASSGAATQLAEVDDWTFTGLAQTTATPEPGTIPLVASGFVLLAGMVRRRRA